MRRVVLHDECHRKRRVGAQLEPVEFGLDDDARSIERNQIEVRREAKRSATDVVGPEQGKPGARLRLSRGELAASRWPVAQSRDLGTIAPITAEKEAR